MACTTTLDAIVRDGQNDWSITVVLTTQSGSTKAPALGLVGVVGYLALALGGIALSGLTAAAVEQGNGMYAIGFDAAALRANIPQGTASVYLCVNQPGNLAQWYTVPVVEYRVATP